MAANLWQPWQCYEKNWRSLIVRYLDALCNADETFYCPPLTVSPLYGMPPIAIDSTGIAIDSTGLCDNQYDTKMIPNVMRKSVIPSDTSTE